MTQLVNFSVVNMKEDFDTFKFMADMYATCQEFLDIGAGDFEEHAILLANFSIAAVSDNPSSARA